jgi:predicted restriction endonuclease
MIIEHQQRGLELLVFYRDRRNEHPGGGFLYLGKFNCGTHSGGGPTNFVLYRASSEMERAVAEVDRSGEFDANNMEDARRKTMAALVRRQGQPAFRRALFAAYEGHCAVTGCAVAEALEAAHIIAYQGPKTNHVTNGLLLRADIHTLFDLGLLSVHEMKLTPVIAASLCGTEYAKLSRKSIFLPRANSDRPSTDALRIHRANAKL